jgi:hypothetical protein
MHDLNLRRFDALALLGLVLAIGAAPVLAADATTRTIAIDSRAMKASKGDYTTTYTIDSGGGLRNIKSDPACFVAALHLPHGVSITRVAVSYASGTANDPYAAVIRNTLAVSDGVELAAGTLANDSGTRRTAALPLNQSIVDNRRYSYGFVTCLGAAATDAFYGARITYSSKPPTD